MTSPTIETDLSKILDQINQNLVNFRNEAKQDLGDFRKEVNQALAESCNEAKQELADFRKEVNQRFDKIDERLTHLQVGAAEIRGDIKALDEKAKGIDERLKSVEFINRSLGVGILVAIVAAVIKLLFPAFLSNP